ncbi:MAG: hypothetical protein CVT48_03850 [Thermoplasmata archaeon HGW-Thermoplasmata-1]|nr:MAG: hypothetical protein CVT48_03850 [Thermoplasmata archaeon HGW-Thermoplasmata-1]
MISREVLEDVAAGWRDNIAGEPVIHRDISPAVEKNLAQEEVTVIKGVRRSGKTFIVYELFQKYGGVYVNFEDERLSGFSNEDFEKLYDIVMAEKGKTSENAELNKKIEARPLLYMDEVQNIAGWEKFAHRAHRKMKMVVTGSNSSLLSSDYATALVGRTKSFTVHPLSYPEFLRFKNYGAERRSLMEYMKLGGFPRIVLGSDISLANEYFDTIIYKDILGNKNLKTSGPRHPDAIKKLAVYLLSNVGKEFSYNSLKSLCGLKHDQTIKEYVALLKDAFLLDILNRFAPSLKTQESYQKKVYSVDPAFINLGKRRDEDYGRRLENIIYGHLKISWDDIYFVKDEKEVDFMLCSGLEPKKLINVTYDAGNEGTLQREIASLNHFSTRFKIPAELIAAYPCPTPPEIGFRLAHRYLLKQEQEGEKILGQDNSRCD